MAEGGTAIQKKTLESELERELERASLDVQFWAQTLKSKFDITDYNQLQFEDTFIATNLLKYVRYNWETNALNQFLEDAKDKKREQEMKDRREKDMKDSISLLTEIKNLRDDGKHRSDEVVKGKEQQLRQCLQVPDEALHSTYSDVSLDDVINKLEAKLGEATKIQRRELSPPELISSASGGIALRGILLTNNMTKTIEACTEIRKTVFKAPKDITLLSSISSESDRIVEFTTRKQSYNFNRSLDILGYDIAISGKGGRYGFQSEAGLNKHHDKESCSEVKANRNEVFHYKEIIAYVPKSICELREDKLEFTESAAEDLRKIEVVIEGTSDEELIRKKCNNFFESYGSHVNTGIIEFGGMYRWRATYSKECTSNKQDDTSMVRDTLVCFKSISYSGFGVSAGGSVSGDYIKANSSITLDYNETELSMITLDILKKGGPQEITSLSSWKTGLKNNETWVILNRGSNLERDFVGIWKIIKYNSDSFKNSKKLSDTLRNTWQAINNITPIDNSIEDNIFDFNKYLDKIQQWNNDPDFVNNIADHLGELHSKVEEICRITGESKLWVTKLRADEPLTDFISKVLQIKDQISEANLIYVQFRINELIKLTYDSDFPKRTELLQWMVSLKTKQYNITDHLIPKDIPNFVSIIRESLQPAMDFDSVYMKATNNLSQLVRNLQTKLDADNKHRDLFFVVVVLRVMKYDLESWVTKEMLETFVSTFENFYKEYNDHHTAGDVECFAFLISELVGSLVGRLNDGSMHEEFQRIYGAIKIHSPQTINNFIARNTECPPYRWQTIRSTFNDVKKGNVKLLEITDMTDFNNVFDKNRPIVQQKKQRKDGDEYIRKSEELTESKKGTDVDDEQLLDTCTACSQGMNLTKPLISLKCSISASEIGETELSEKGKLILEQFGLIDYYPSKISLRNVMAVSDLPKDSIVMLPWRIMQRLIMLDFNGCDNEITNYAQLCKNNKTEKSDIEDFSIDSIIRDAECATLSTQHPQDIFQAIFACCDLILKQTIISKMFLCRLAVPFLSPELIGESLQLSVWALRSIIVEHKVDDAFKYSSVIKEPIKTISFIRLGNPGFSKSILLNHVINNQLHHSFWNRECPFSQVERQLADGLVECQWFIPSCKRVNTFNDVTMFMNLRGDACKFKKQVSVMKYFSNIIVSVVDISDIERSDIFDYIKDLHAAPIKNILVLTNKNLEAMNTDVLKMQLEPLKIFGKNFSFILGFNNNSKRVKTIADITNEIREAVKALLQNENGKVIEDICYKQKMDGILIDEEAELCKSAKELALEVMSCMDSNSTDECKRTMLLLQGNIQQKLSKLQKKKERSGRNSQKLNVILEKERIQQTMDVLRKKQLDYSMPLSKLMKSFLMNLIKTVETPTSVFFQQWLKFYLNEKSRNTLPSLRSDYQSKWVKLNDSGGECQSDITQNLKTELVDAEKKLADPALGLEHLLREMSQIYEAAIESKQQLSQETLKNIRQLPYVAAKLLTEGQPIEIMNGDTRSVPITWIKDVFNGLEKLLGDKKLYAISVLGVQSSGKSTLMNTVFGLQFASSVGRCTRGAFMQLIEVKDKGMNYDYVLVIDTEGLRAPQVGQTKHVHDNELATFVIGIGDVTIINIKGENMAEISDVLQIAVHAFLRMRLVNKNFKLHRNCVFIHQNVPAVDAKDKMQQGCQKIQETLDRLTKKVCQIESISYINSFNQIIDFDRNNHVWYFSDLWRGDPPMAPINPGYAENAQDVRHCLLNDIPNKLTVLTLTGMIQRIEDVWSGVLSDDFVFSFKNSLAASAYHSLGSEYNDLKWNIEFEITEWLQTNIITQLQDCVSCDLLKELSIELQSELSSKVVVLTNTAENKLKEFFATHNLKDYLIEWKHQTIHHLEQDSNEYLRRAKREINHTAESLMFDFNQRKMQKYYEKDILQKAREFAESNKGIQVGDQQLLNMFNNVWAQWVSELTAHNYDEPVNIEEIVEKMLFDNLQKDSHQSLRKEIEKHPLTDSFPSNVLKGSMDACEIEVEYHLCEKKSKNIFKRAYNWKKRNDKFQFNKDEIVNDAATVIDCIFENVGIYLNDLSQVSSRFQESHASQLIKKVIKGIDEHNGDKEQYFTIRSTLKVKLAVHTSRFAIVIFKKMHADYDEKNSITKKLNAYEKHILHLFKNMVKQNTNEVIAADFLYNKLVAAIKEVLDIRLSLEIVKDIVHHFRTKYQLMIEILDDLADKANFDNYKFFIGNAKGYSLEWLTKFINRKFFDADKKEYMTVLQSLTSGIIKDLIKCIKSASDAELSKKKEDQSTVTWSKNFHTCLTKIKIPESELTLVSELDVIDYVNLQRLLLDKCSGMTKEVLGMFKDLKPEDITRYSQILEKLWSCRAQCPFCNEPCTIEHTTDNTNHRCLQHRPKGVSGIRWGEGSKKGELVIESCNFDVQNKDVAFKCLSSKNECRASGKCTTTGNEQTVHKYIEYKTYLPTWDIAPSNCMDESKYWMWFIATYKHQLSEDYNAKLPDIPDTWNKITIQQAKDSLRIF